MKLNKESKIRVLESFYSLDYILFGKPLSKIEACCQGLKEEAMLSKSALLSVIIEMFKLVEHSPKPIAEKINTETLNKMAIDSAKVARKNSAKLVVTEQSKNEIKEMVKESLNESKEQKVESLMEAKIRQKAYQLAIDDLLIGRTLTEAKNLKAMKESFEANILEDSYKILRDNLVEVALLINDQA